MFKKILLGFFGVSFLSGATWAGFGVSSPFAKVAIGSAEPGGLIRISAVARPLTVTNTSDIPITVSLRVTRPKGNEVDGGYEPIPSVVWVVLEKNEFTLAPGESATTDMILKPPLERKYGGRNYQVHILSRAVGSGNVRIVMVHKLQFSVLKEAAIPNRSSEKTKMKVEPLLFEAKNIDLGRLSEDPSRALIVHNTDKKSHCYRIRTFNPEASAEYERYAIRDVSTPLQNKSDQSAFSLQPGEQKTVSASNRMIVMFDELLPRNWVSLGVKEFKLKPGEKRSFPIKVFIPNHDSLKNKKMVSLVRVTQLDDEFSSTFVPIYLATTIRGYADAPQPEFQKSPYVDVHVEMAQ